MTKAKAWISAARIRTLPLSLSGILVASGAANLIGFFKFPVFIFAILSTLGFQILSNFANDYGDGIKGTDNLDRIGPARAMQSGLLSAKELKLGMIVTTGLTLLFVSLLIYTAFGRANFLLSFIFFNLGIIAIIAAITYTVGKNAYGYRALGDFFVFVFFGLVGVIGCYYLYTQMITNFILLPALTIGLLSTAVLHLNNMRDRITDLKSNKFTLAVKFGEKNSKYYHTFLIGTAFLSALLYLILIYTDILIFITLIAFVPIIHNVKTVYKTDSPALLDPELKKIALSTFLFALLFFGYSFI